MALWWQELEPLVSLVCKEASIKMDSMQKKSSPPVLDMTLDGEFRRPVRPPFSARFAVSAMVAAMIVTGLAAAALAIWLAVLMIPVAVVALAVAYIAARVLRVRSAMHSSFL
ncbi:Hypothetical protein GbCGDNIH4_1337 [Granulibacter bethesdensis CGDNIH4]|nr:Hypothetical protein GbCGDNIH4_1337 [Granulibacter bethesdensis CGDNIH4]